MGQVKQQLEKPVGLANGLGFSSTWLSCVCVCVFMQGD